MSSLSEEEMVKAENEECRETKNWGVINTCEPPKEIKEPMGEREWTPDEEMWVKQNKRWRKLLDALLQEVKGAERRSRPRSILVTKLQEAIMWAGMDLKELNDGRSIYADSYDPSNTRVDPMADGLKL